MSEQPNPWSEAGAYVPDFHSGPCGGRLTRITTYGSDAVVCERCEAEYPVEEKFGSLVFAEARNA